MFKGDDLKHLIPVTIFCSMWSFSVGAENVAPDAFQAENLPGVYRITPEFLVVISRSGEDYRVHLGCREARFIEASNRKAPIVCNGFVRARLEGTSLVFNSKNRVFSGRRIGLAPGDPRLLEGGNVLANDAIRVDGYSVADVVVQIATPDNIVNNALDLEN